MKVCYISSSRVPSRTANSIHVMKMCQAFTQEGHDVTLLVPLPDTPGASENIWLHYGISDRFNIHHVPDYRFLHGYAFLLNSVLSARRMNPDLVYTRHLGAGLVAARLRIPAIVELHGLPATRNAPLFLRLLVKGQGFKHLVVISHSLKHLILERYSHFLRDEDILVAPDAVDLDRFNNLPSPQLARKQIGIPAEQFTAGYAGHLYQGRGIELILTLAQQLPDMQFLIMGGRQGDITYYQSVATERQCRNAHFTGFVPNAELPGYMAACDVLLMPYQRQVATAGGDVDTSAWMSPMKMFEYMAMERLLISSDLPVLREILNLSNAHFCDPEDAACWRQALEKARLDSRWCDQLAAQARRDVESYTWNKRVRHVLQGRPN